MEYAQSHTLKTGWTDELRSSISTGSQGGKCRGASFSKFIEFIRTDAVASLSPEKKEDFAGLLAKKQCRNHPLKPWPKPWRAGFVRVGNGGVKRIGIKGLKERNFESGRKMFAAGGCFACHRFGNQGGMNGPDLTGSGGRYPP